MNVERNDEHIDEQDNQINGLISQFEVKMGIPYDELFNAMSLATRQRGVPEPEWNIHNANRKEQKILRQFIELLNTEALYETPLVAEALDPSIAVVIHKILRDKLQKEIEKKKQNNKSRQ